MKRRLRLFGIVLLEKLRGLVRDRSVREAFFVFALTRGILLAIFIAAMSVTFDVKAPDYNRDDPHPTVRVRSAEFQEKLNYLLTRGDAGWYLGIARNGYERRAFEAQHQHNWGFFPLYPLTVRVLVGWTGQHLIFGALLSGILFFVALVLLHKLVVETGFDAPTADRAIFYLAAFPASYFFSLVGTESLFLCLAVGSFLAAARGKWWAAGILGGFASGTRLVGTFLLPSLVLFYGQRTPRFRWGRDILWLGLVPVGLLIFMLFLWRITGNPFAFSDIVIAWQRTTGFFLATLYDYLKHPLHLIEPWNFRALNFAAAIMALGAAIFWARRRHWAFASFSFLAIALPLSSSTLVAGARYVSIIFPLFIALAIAGDRPRIDQIIRVTFVVFFGLMTLFYALRFSFAAT